MLLGVDSVAVSFTGSIDRDPADGQLHEGSGTGRDLA